MYIGELPEDETVSEDGVIPYSEDGVHFYQVPLSALFAAGGGGGGAGLRWWTETEKDFSRIVPIGEGQMGYERTTETGVEIWSVFGHEFAGYKAADAQMTATCGNGINGELTISAEEPWVGRGQEFMLTCGSIQQIHSEFVKSSPNYFVCKLRMNLYFDEYLTDDIYLDHMVPLYQEFPDDPYWQEHQYYHHGYWENAVVKYKYRTEVDDGEGGTETVWHDRPYFVNDVPFICIATCLGEEDVSQSYCDIPGIDFKWNAVANGVTTESDTYSVQQASNLDTWVKWDNAQKGSIFRRYGHDQYFDDRKPHGGITVTYGNAVWKLIFITPYTNELRMSDADPSTSKSLRGYDITQEMLPEGLIIPATGIPDITETLGGASLHWSLRQLAFPQYDNIGIDYKVPSSIEWQEDGWTPDGWEDETHHSYQKYETCNPLTLTKTSISEYYNNLKTLAYNVISAMKLNAKGAVNAAFVKTLLGTESGAGLQFIGTNSSGEKAELSFYIDPLTGRFWSRSSGSMNQLNVNEIYVDKIHINTTMDGDGSVPEVSAYQKRLNAGNNIRIVDDTLDPGAQIISAITRVVAESNCGINITEPSVGQTLSVDRDILQTRLINMSRDLIFEDDNTEGKHLTKIWNDAVSEIRVDGVPLRKQRSDNASVPGNYMYVDLQSSDFGSAEKFPKPTIDYWNGITITTPSLNQPFVFYAPDDGIIFVHVEKSIGSQTQKKLEANIEGIFKWYGGAPQGSYASNIKDNMIPVKRGTKVVLTLSVSSAKFYPYFKDGKSSDPNHNYILPVPDFGTRVDISSYYNSAGSSLEDEGYAYTVPYDGIIYTSLIIGTETSVTDKVGYIVIWPEDDDITYETFKFYYYGEEDVFDYIPVSKGDRVRITGPEATGGYLDFRRFKYTQDADSIYSPIPDYNKVRSLSLNTGGTTTSVSFGSIVSGLFLDRMYRYGDTYQDYDSIKLKLQKNGTGNVYKLLSHSYIDGAQSGMPMDASDSFFYTSLTTDSNVRGRGLLIPYEKVGSGYNKTARVLVDGENVTDEYGVARVDISNKLPKPTYITNNDPYSGMYCTVFDSSYSSYTQIASLTLSTDTSYQPHSAFIDLHMTAEDTEAQAGDKFYVWAFITRQGNNQVARDDSDVIAQAPSITNFCKEFEFDANGKIDIHITGVVTGYPMNQSGNAAPTLYIMARTNVTHAQVPYTLTKAQCVASKIF